MLLLDKRLFNMIGTSSYLYDQLPVSTFFNQLWEDIDELLASICGVQLSYPVEHCSPIMEWEISEVVSTIQKFYHLNKHGNNSPGLDFCRSIVDSWNGLTTAQKNNELT